MAGDPGSKVGRAFNLLVGAIGVILVTSTGLVAFDPGYPGRTPAIYVVFGLFLCLASAPYVLYVVISRGNLLCLIFGTAMLGATAWLNTVPLRSTSSTAGLGLVASMFANYGLVAITWGYTRLVRRSAT
jgi:hypothetical protein